VLLLLLLVARPPLLLLWLPPPLLLLLLLVLLLLWALCSCAVDPCGVHKYGCVQHTGSCWPALKLIQNIYRGTQQWQE
jgi:hypothetical protein